MNRLSPAMRLKVKKDTFFIPDSNGEVYFRNNASSFRMKGRAIDQWVEKLLPMLNGEHSLEELTSGLSALYRERVFDMAEVLYRNGFARDVSRDRPHQLSDEVLKRYASQIEFLDQFVDSPAYRFQTFRRAKMLAIGCGSFFVSLASALLESGLPRFHMLVTGPEPTNRERLAELEVQARKTDPEVAIEEITLPAEGESYWRELVRPFDSILYVSPAGDLNTLRVLHKICLEEEKLFLPALQIRGVGMAGPLVRPGSEGCWESAWRRIHQSVFNKDRDLHAFSSTAGAMLANVIVFEWFKQLTGVSDRESQFFLLDLQTLEGSWHSFLPHPLVDGRAKARWVDEIEESDERSEWFLHLTRWTSAKSGILHLWEEGDLKQLPLAQCRVQAADPLSEGPAERLPSIVCTGLTHEEARREAGLSGIEAYVSRMVDRLAATLSKTGGSTLAPGEYVGLGAGVTKAEAVCRGLEKCLDQEFHKRMTGKNHVSRVELRGTADDRCRYYLKALTAVRGKPTIGLGENMSGFPVVWVGVDGRWYGSVGLNITLAMRKALQQALAETQNRSHELARLAVRVSSVSLADQGTQPLSIPACEEITRVLASAVPILKREKKRLCIFECLLEPELKEGLAGVFGVVLREEESR